MDPPGSTRIDRDRPGSTGIEGYFYRQAIVATIREEEEEEEEEEGGGGGRKKLMCT